MAETSLLWPTTGSGDVSPHSVAVTAELFNIIMGASRGGSLNQGVIPNVLNSLVPTVSGTNILVASGWAVCDGHPYKNSASLSKTPVIPTTGTTGRRLVLRATWAGATQTVRVTEISSADGTAAIPAMTQTTGVTYDIPLCSYTVAITTGAIASFVDTRVFAGGSSPATDIMLALGGGALTAPALAYSGRVLVVDWKAAAAAIGLTTIPSVSGGLGLWCTVAATNPVSSLTGLVLSFAAPGSTATLGIGTVRNVSAVATISAVVAPDRSPWMRCRIQPDGGSNYGGICVGFLDAITGQTANGAYIRRDTTGNLFFVTRQGGAETTTDLGAKSSALMWFDIWTPDAGVTWYCRDHTGALLATHTTNVPTVTVDLAVLAYQTDTGGATPADNFAASDIHVSMIDE